MRDWQISAATDIVQVGIVVPDIEKAAAFCTSILGTGPFEIMERQVSGILKGYSETSAPLGRTKIAKALKGRTEFELIQFIEGNAAFKDFILGRGFGPHHFGFRVIDLSKELGTLWPPEYELILRIKAGAVNAAFLKGTTTGGMIIELVQA